MAIGSNNHGRRSEMLKLRLDGHSYRKVGKLLGISGQRVQQVLRPPRSVYRAVVDKANAHCEDCGIAVSSGHVHHIGATGLTPEYFDDIDNLQYLCVSCHRKAHNFVSTKAR